MTKMCQERSLSQDTQPQNIKYNQTYRLMRLYFYDRFNLGSFIRANHSRTENSLGSLFACEKHRTIMF